MSALPTTDLLTAARAGDESAFAALVEPHRRDLHAHCYRMLGSLQDAEDALQDALLRAWRGLGRFEGRASLRTWLHRIATNACLDLAKRRPARVLPIDYGPPADPHDGPGAPLTESVWVEPYPDEHAGLRAARERRAGVRRRAPAPAGEPARGADPARGARVLGPRGGGHAGDARWRRSTAPCSGRARRWTSACRPRASRRPCARWATSGCEQLVTRTWTHGSAATSRRSPPCWPRMPLVTMPPMATWFQRPRGVRGRSWPSRPSARERPAPRARARQRPGGLRQLHVGRGARALRGGHVLQVLTLRGDRIAEVTAFVEPALCRAVRASRDAAMSSAPGRSQFSYDCKSHEDLGPRSHLGGVADGRPRRTRRHHRAEHHPGGPRRLHRAARMDGQRLQPELRRPAHDRGRGRATGSADGGCSPPGSGCSWPPRPRARWRRTSGG